MRRGGSLTWQQRQLQSHHCGKSRGWPGSSWQSTSGHSLSAHSAGAGRPRCGSGIWEGKKELEFLPSFLSPRARRELQGPAVVLLCPIQPTLCCPRGQQYLEKPCASRAFTHFCSRAATRSSSWV